MFHHKSNFEQRPSVCEYWTVCSFCGRFFKLQQSNGYFVLKTYRGIGRRVAARASRIVVTLKCLTRFNSHTDSCDRTSLLTPYYHPLLSINPLINCLMFMQLWLGAPEYWSRDWWSEWWALWYGALLRNRELWFGFP